MLSRRRERGSLPMEGLTPLLDTLFILLFSLLALSDVRRSSAEEIRIELPQVEPGADETDVASEVVAIEIGAEGEVRLAGHDTPLPTRAAFDEALDRHLEGRHPEEVMIEIRADRRTEHGVAITLLQHLRLRGLLRVQLLATGYEEPGGEPEEWR